MIDSTLTLLYILALSIVVMIVGAAVILICVVGYGLWRLWRYTMDRGE